MARNGMHTGEKVDGIAVNESISDRVLLGDTDMDGPKDSDREGDVVGMAEPHRETRSSDGQDDDRVRNLSKTTKVINIWRDNDDILVDVLDTYDRWTTIFFSSVSWSHHNSRQERR